MSVGRIINFRATYLLPYIMDGSAIPDRSMPGYYRHELVLSAFSEREVLAEIRDRSGIVLDVVQLPPRNPLFTRVSRTYKQQFLQALAFNVNAGISPDRALEQVILGETDSNRVQLNVAQNTLRRGRGFLEAIEALGWFDETTLAILHAGERTGQLPRALQTTVDHFGNQSDTMKLMFGAIIWTIFDLFMAISTVIGMRFGLIPSLTEQGIKSEDPLKVEAFKRSLKVATAVNDLLLVGTAIAIIVIIFVMIAYLGPDDKFRKKVDAAVMKSPIVSQALLHSGMATTTKIMASLLKGGVTFLNAVTITAQGTRVPSVIDFWTSIRTRAENGEAVAMAFSHEMLSGSERMILRSHADQEQLAHTMEIVSANREELAKKASKQFAIAAFILSLLYSGIAVLFALWVVYLQNEAVLSGAPA
jgi:type II secretory pathway component PulF